ncbi:hypothetical protein Tsubulata_043430, partial [Turnera subulata]
YCGKVFAGGGINRFKRHLAGIKGDAEPCSQAVDEIVQEMRGLIEGFVANKRKAQERIEEQNPYGPSQRMQEEQIYERLREEGPKILEQKVRELKDLLMWTNQFILCAKNNSRCSTKVAKCPPKQRSQGKYYQQAIDAIATMGSRYKGPSFHDIRGFLLTKNVEKVNKYVHSYRKTWTETGCTIMADGWTDHSRRILIIFLIYCPRGTVFLKSVDASKIADMLYKLFRK